MTDKSPTLAEMQSYLSHKADPVAKVAPPSGDLPRKGSRPQFDEDKVKRDGRGRFARKQAMAALNKAHDEMRARQNAELKRKFGLDMDVLTTGDIQEYIKSHKSEAADMIETVTRQVEETVMLEDKVAKEHPILKEIDTTPDTDVIYDLTKKKYVIVKHSDSEGYQAAEIDIRHLGHKDIDEFIAHYGVKGMRWGIVRSDAQLGVNRGPRANSTGKERSDAGTASRAGSSNRLRSGKGDFERRSDRKSDLGDRQGTGRSGGGYARAGRKSDKDSSEGNSKADAARAVLKSKAVNTAKTAYGINSQLKAIDKRLALPSLAFAAGVAVAGVTGVGLPAVAGLSIGHKVFSDPTVQAALKSASSYSKAIIKDVGNVKLSDMKMPNMPKVSNPFQSRTINRSTKVLSPSSISGPRSNPAGITALKIKGLSA